MQSLEARQQYRNSFHCGYRIFTEEGLLRFWTGTTPRLARLVVCDISEATIALILNYFLAQWRDRFYTLRKYHKRDRRQIGIKSIRPQEIELEFG